MQTIINSFGQLMGQSIYENQNLQLSHISQRWKTFNDSWTSTKASFSAKLYIT